MKAKDFILVVKEKYSKITNILKQQKESLYCGNRGCYSTVDYTIFCENFNKLEGYNSDTDLDYGIPTQFAKIKTGDHVLDLGCGTGNDCFVARAIVGETGKVTGLDFTDAMIVKATENNKKLGFTNVEFIKGDIEEMPLPDKSFDVVVSNCVLHLVPNKKKAFAEIMRVLKSGGHFCVSDIVIKGVLPETLRKDNVIFASNITDAIDMDNYLYLIADKGFNSINVHRQREITISEKTLEKHLTKEEIGNFKIENTGIFYITVSAWKN